MPDAHHNVSLQTVDPSQHQPALPAHFGEYVVACEQLREMDVFDELEQHFRLDRGGYQFIDAVLVGLAFFGACPRYSGLRGVVDDAHDRGWAESLAAVAGRHTLCSQASLSRVLDDVPIELAHDFTRRLLSEWTPAGQLADHETLVWHDCKGQQWHGFAIDGRVQPFRRRALCEDEAYPQPRRLVDKLGAKPGHSGRKRADVQMHTSILEHMGSSLYLAMNYAPGNGDLTDDFAAGLAQIEGWARSCGVDPERCFLAIDGESGGFSQLRHAVASPVHFLTRLSYYQPLKDPGFRARLAEQTWHRVEDARSGPTRWATEMGDYHLGQAKARLVVSCFEPADGKKRGAGYFVDGLQYEVYACDFDPAAFPGAEVVSTYYARAGRQENGFAQQDQHMDLERVYSGSQPGQIVMMALGMWMHNFRATAGAQLFGELASCDIAPQVRQVESAAALPLVPPNRAETEASTKADESTPSSATPGLDASQKWWQRVTEKVEERIAGLDGFSYDAERVRIGCTKGVYLELTGLRERDGHVVLRFRIISRSECRDCPFRDGCTSSISPTYRKEIGIQMPPPDPPRETDEHDSRADQEQSDEQDNTTQQTAGSTQTSTTSLGLRPPNSDQLPAAGGFEMRQPMLVASVFRNAFRRAARKLEVDVDVSRQPPASTDVEYLALTPARRQRRRQTWVERLQWNGLCERTTVKVEVKAPPQAMALLWGTITAEKAKPLKYKANE